MYNDEILAEWLEHLLGELPPMELFDAHVHFGLADPAGFIVSPDAMRASLDRIGSRGLIFSLKDAGGYRAPNDEALRLARESDGRLHALCRVVPGQDAAGEARRCVEAGAAGIKLHPSGDDLSIADPRLDPVFELADELRLPMMIHAGIGASGVGHDALARCERHPGAQLIMAHELTACMSWVWREVENHPNLFFDTSWWSPADHMATFALIPPGRLLFASDIPFASAAQGALHTLRCAMQVGLGDEAIASVMGGQLDRLVRREPALDAGPAPGPDGPLHPTLERVYVDLIMAAERMMGANDPGQGIHLARDACRVGEDDEHAELLAAIVELLDLAEAAQTPDPGRTRTPGFDLVLTAAILARTPDVPVPSFDREPISIFAGAG